MNVKRFKPDVTVFSDKKKRMQLLKKSIPYVVVGYLGNLISFAFRNSEKTDIIGKLMDSVEALNTLFTDPFPSLHVEDILVGILFGIMLRVAVWVKGMDAKHYRKGEEYGSARLGGTEDIEPFINRKDMDNNLIFSQTEMMSLEGRMPSPLYNRNKNVIVIGGSGSGKTRFYAKPNLMQLNCSYVVTDPKGTVLPECGYLLKKNNYKIKVLNTIDFSKSMHYNRATCSPLKRWRAALY